jgi:low temperature requirement protein LtrA
VSLIALGEWSAANVAAFAIGFAGTVALWWLYFGRSAAGGAGAIARSGEAARLGRVGYAYAHAVMVAGVIVVAVGIEKTVAHPTGSTSAGVACAILGGPALFFAGNGVFKFALTGRIPVSRMVALAALAMLEPLALVASPLVLSAAATLVTAALAAWPGPPSVPLRDGSPGEREDDADGAGGEERLQGAPAQDE